MREGWRAHSLTGPTVLVYLGRAVYLSYFGLAERPFAITPDPRFLYLGDRHREGLSHLLYGMGAHGGFVQLTGEVGTGKTTLWRYVLQRLPPEVDVAVILNSRLTAIELLATVCDELRVEYPSGSASAKVLVDALYRYLLDAHARGRRTVLIIDEAQNLGADALEQVRMLTNLETPLEKLLQIILIGQPELAQLLEQKELRQVAQRITARYHLLPFTEQETRAYVLYRMQVAGQPERVFDDGALDEVHRRSGGIPRLINVVCDRALLGAYATRESRVDARLVRRAADEVFSSPTAPPAAPRPRWRPITAVLGAVVLTAAVLAFALHDGRLTRGLHWARRALLPGAGSPAVARATGATEGSEPRPAATTKRSDLVGVLASPSPSGGKAAAFARLYALWGVDFHEKNAAAPCDAGRPAGLRCFSGRGTWRVLRRLDLPAVIELVTPAGVKRQAAVTALDGERATLELGTERHVFPLTEIDRVWDGRFIVVWRAPAGVREPIAPGVRGPGVAWLRQRLAEVDRTPLPSKPSDVYDAELRRRVVAFQRSQSLDADGIVGEETLLRLTAVLDPRTPSLSPARPRG